MGLVSLDEIVLEQERLGLGTYDRVLEIRNVRHHRRDLGACDRSAREIAL